MDSTPQSVIANIDEIVAREEGQAAQRGPVARAAAAIGNFFASIRFVALQLTLVIAWLTLNLGFGPFPPFDPPPFSLGGTLLSLEGVLLAAFVLIKQAHESELSERRSHLALQASLLVEKEVTTLIQMLTRMSEAEGTQARVVDAEARELGQATALGTLVEELDKRLDP